MLIQSIHAIILIFTVVISFLIKTPLYHYEFFFVLIVLLLYIIIKGTLKPLVFQHRLIDSVLFTFIITTLINSTGEIHSPLFFLLYCLIFGLSLLLEPFVSFATAVSLIILYLLSIPPNQTIADLLPLFSLAFISPFAFFLGEEYQKILEQKKDIIILKKKNEDLQEKINHLIAEYEKK
ncbi:MAG TPA: hypothetical protein VJB63_03645 [Patescibacteria group bacterium]|nr:hypothetical protein [Patescibacteria group bacterium]